MPDLRICQLHLTRIMNTVRVRVRHCDSFGSLSYVMDHPFTHQIVGSIKERKQTLLPFYTIYLQLKMRYN